MLRFYFYFSFLTIKRSHLKDIIVIISIWMALHWIYLKSKNYYRNQFKNYHNLYTNNKNRRLFCSYISPSSSSSWNNVYCECLCFVIHHNQEHNFCILCKTLLEMNFMTLSSSINKLDYISTIVTGVEHMNNSNFITKPCSITVNRN